MSYEGTLYGPGLGDVNLGPGQTVDFTVDDATQNASSVTQTLTHTYNAGAGAANIGASTRYRAETSTAGTIASVGDLRFVLTTATAASEAGAFRVALVAAGALPAEGSEQLRLASTGNLTISGDYVMASGKKLFSPDGGSTSLTLANASATLFYGSTLGLTFTSSAATLQSSGNDYIQGDSEWRITTGGTLRSTFNASGLTMGSAVFVQRSVSAAVTASTTQTQLGGTALTSEFNNISVCANANDTVTLMAAVAGRVCSIYNNGAQTLQIFPASGDNLGAGVDTATTLAAGSNRRFEAYDGTNWEVL